MVYEVGEDDFYDRQIFGDLNQKNWRKKLCLQGASTISAICKRYLTPEECSRLVIARGNLIEQGNEAKDHGVLKTKLSLDEGLSVIGLWIRNSAYENDVARCQYQSVPWNARMLEWGSQCSTTAPQHPPLRYHLVLKAPRTSTKDGAQ